MQASRSWDSNCDLGVFKEMRGISLNVTVRAVSEAILRLLPAKEVNSAVMIFSVGVLRIVKM